MKLPHGDQRRQPREAPVVIELRVLVGPEEEQPHSSFRGILLRVHCPESGDKSVSSMRTAVTSRRGASISCRGYDDQRERYLGRDVQALTHRCIRELSRRDG